MHSYRRVVGCTMTLHARRDRVVCYELTYLMLSEYVHGQFAKHSLELWFSLPLIAALRRFRCFTFGLCKITLHANNIGVTASNVHTTQNT